MKKLPLVCALFFIAFLAGCASPKINPVEVGLNKSNSSVLYFQRKSQFINGAVDYWVYVNDQYIGALKDGGNLERRVEPGNMLVLFKAVEFGGIPNFGKEELRIDVEVGYDYRIQMGFGMDSIGIYGGLVSVGKTTSISVNKTLVEK
jgi:hypothetical protein